MTFLSYHIDHSSRFKKLQISIVSCFASEQNCVSVKKPWLFKTPTWGKKKHKKNKLFDLWSELKWNEKTNLDLLKLFTAHCRLHGELSFMDSFVSQSQSFLHSQFLHTQAYITQAAMFPISSIYCHTIVCEEGCKRRIKSLRCGFFFFEGTHNPHPTHTHTPADSYVTSQQVQ